MNPLYRVWWLALAGARVPLRVLFARLHRLGVPAIFCRWALHLAVGNPITVALLVLVLVMPLDLRSTAITTGVVVAVVEGWLRVPFDRLPTDGRLGWPVRVSTWIWLWREGWRFRRGWPALWALVAAKTTRVQAEVGSSKEPVVTIRPILDHPRLSMWPQVTGTSVSWWIGPPPGRSFDQLASVQTSLSANAERAQAVMVDPVMPGQSWSRLTAQFADPIATVSTAPWAQLPTGDTPAGEVAG